ncbi:MAG: tRNA (5-methylaminomethyl-2-thiouridine)(34)-methyltransferase MnmD [Paracoccaceae bacterium]
MIRSGAPGAEEASIAFDAGDGGVLSGAAADAKDGTASGPAALAWRGDVPVSTLYADAYHAGDGLAEARHVYLAGCGLPERYRPGFVLAETGFGTGLNLAAAWAAWRAAGAAGSLTYVGFEAHPLSAAEMARALGPFPGIAAEAEALVTAWARSSGPVRRLRTPGLDAAVVVGDARETVPAWGGRADAWLLDGFAPARNPALWEPALLAAVARRLAPGGRAASFTAAGRVRRALAAAGLAVERRAGFGTKRHITVARRPEALDDR